MSSALLQRLDFRRADRKRRTSCNSPGHEYGGLYPPASADAVRAAEKSLGYKLPPLLRSIYRKLANGGFGPGFGIIGLRGGYTDPEWLDLSLVDYHRKRVDSGEPIAGNPWPNALLTICNLGHNGSLAVDCSQADYAVVRVEARFLDERVGPFADMMENWAAGTDYF